MKKNCFPKAMIVMAMAATVAGCSHDTDVFDQSAREQESAASFASNVLGGKSVDANQSWSTAGKVTVKVNSELGGTLQFFTANPMGRVSASLLTKTLSAGSTEIAVTKPNDATTLYAALADADHTLRVCEVGADGTVTFKAPAATAAARRRVQKRYNCDFPDAPADSKFLTAVPGGVKKYDEIGQWGYASGTSYLDESHTGDVNIWGNWDGSKTTGGTLYVKGYNDYSNRNFYVAPNTDIYLIAGATLILSANASGNLQSNDSIYMAAGSKLVAKGELKLNSTKLYNRGTVEAPTLSGNDEGTLYNQGTVTVDGELSVTNATTTIVNEGTITAKSYGSYGSGNFWNTGTVNIAATSTVNSNANVWINEGQYNTGDFNYTAGSINVWNLCKMNVTGNFKIQLGDSPTSSFQMDYGSSVVTNTFEMQGPARINMAGNAVFKVNTTATMNITKAGYGIYGPTSGDKWAVFQAKDIVSGRTSGHIYQVSYDGNLFVASDSHFANGWNGQYPYFEQGSAKLCNGQTTAPYTIEANGNCSEGYSGGTTPPVPPVQYYYYAFEDLGTIGDFDFNDVVIRLSAPQDGLSTVEIVAAGGTMQTYVTYGEGERPTRIGAEVHAAMGENSIKTMINTTGVNTDKFAVLGTVSVADDADLSMLPFGIEVKGNDGQTTRVTRSVEDKGRAPLVIVVNGNDEGKWFWPTEKTSIVSAYKGFGNWGANVASDLDWYKNATEGKVVSY